MAKHALLSASGAHRWLLCTPSAQLEQKFPASTSAYAEEGTVAHALAELTTRYFLGELDEVSYENQIKSEFEPNSYYNAEMRECAVAYAKFVTGRLAEAKKTCPDAMIILETRLDFSKYVPGGFGTGDCVIIAEPILDVIDFKYGKGHRVEAEDNPQMQLYGLGALEQFGDLYEIKTVRMTIFQPRLSGIEDSSEKTVKELTSWGKSYVKPRAKLADKGEGDFAPSEEACRFCRAKNQCRARAEENLKLFDESPDPLLISPEEAGAILAKSADIETWLKDLRELVSGALTAGETVTGWKMVEGRSNRKFADEDKVVAAMKAAGYDESLLYDRKLITLNVIVHLPSWLEGLFKVTERRAENKLIISVGGHSNTYYLFGGRDESSYTLVQGMTLAGVLFDEVALMPRSFVEQALARCSVAGSKFWFNCNPEGPMHWFYKEWVLECKRRNVLHLHFTMADNLSLSEKIKQRYGNEFVPYVVLTEKMLNKIQACTYSMDIFNQVAKMTTNYRVWEKVTDYLVQCSDIIADKVENAKAQG